MNQVFRAVNLRLRKKFIDKEMGLTGGILS
jgi:hypothetical protein